MKIELLEETGSTNDEIRRYLDGGEDVIVCARRQTGGRGTKGRSFLSEEGGVYLTALTFYDDLPAEDAFRIMSHAAAAVCRTAEAFGISPEIKWPNDVLAAGKKLCGILIENVLSGGKVRASIVGIGLNVRNELRGLEEIAVGMKDLLQDPPEADAVRERLIGEYLRPSGFGEYCSHVKFLGRPISVTEGENTYSAVARRILPDGRLEIETERGIRALSAAEISIRI